MALQIHEYDLTPEEAWKKLAYIQQRLFSEQFHQNWYIKDVRSDVRLRYELIAFWEGRITEMHGWDDVLGQIWDSIKEPMEALLNTIWRTVIKPGIQAIMSTFSTIWSGIYSIVQSIISTLEGIWSYLYDVYQRIEYHVWGAIRQIWDWVRGAADTIYSMARRAVASVRGWLTDLYSDYIQPLIRGYFESWRTVWSSTLNVVGQIRTVVGGVWDQLGAMWDDIVEKVSGAFESVTRALSSLGQSIVAGLKSAVSYISDVFKSFWHNVLVPFGQTLYGYLQQAWNWIQEKLYGIYETVKSAFSRLAPLTPEKAVGTVTGMLSTTGIGAVGLLSMAGMWDLIHPIKNWIPGQLKAMMYDVTSFNQVLGQFTHPLWGTSVGTPMRYYFNALFRPWMPRWEDYMELYSRHFITPSELQRAMMYYGYDPSYYFKYFDELAKTPLRYFALSAIARQGYWDERFMIEELQRSGYSDYAIKTLMQTYQSMANDAARGAYGSVVIRRFRTGIISTQQLREELTMLGYPSRQREQLVTGARLYYDLDAVEDAIDAIRYSFRRGKITEGEMIRQLAQLGIRTEMISRIVLVERARAKEEVGATEGEEVRAYGRGTAIKRFREGMTSEAQLRNELKLLGYSDQWIDRLVVAARLERDYDFAQTVLSYVKTAFRKRLIDDARAEEILLAFGFTKEKIMLELSLVRLAYGLGLSEEDIAS